MSKNTRPSNISSLGSEILNNVGPLTGTLNELKAPSSYNYDDDEEINLFDDDDYEDIPPKKEIKKVRKTFVLTEETINQINAIKAFNPKLEFSEIVGAAISKYFQDKCTEQPAIKSIFEVYNQNK